jgi:PAS domain-containing protein
VILDSNWRVVVANRGFFRIFQVEPEDIEGRPLDEMINLPWEITRLWETQGTMPRADAKLGNFEAELKSPTSGRFTLRFGAHCLRGAGLNLMVLAIEEIVGRNRSFPALP